MKQFANPFRRLILYWLSTFSAMNESNKEGLPKMLFMKMLKKSLLIQRPSGSQTDVQPERQNALTAKQIFKKTDTKTWRHEARQTNNTDLLSTFTHLWNQESSPTAGCLPDQLHWQPARQTAHSSQCRDRLTQSNQWRCLNTNRGLTEFWAWRWR